MGVKVKVRVKVEVEAEVEVEDCLSDVAFVRRLKPERQTPRRLTIPVLNL